MQLIAQLFKPLARYSWHAAMSLARSAVDVWLNVVKVASVALRGHPASKTLIASVRPGRVAGRPSYSTEAAGKSLAFRPQCALPGQRNESLVPCSCSCSCLSLWRGGASRFSYQTEGQLGGVMRYLPA